MRAELEVNIRNLEETFCFQPYWSGIFINPFFITRKALFMAVNRFASTLKPNDTVLDVGCGIQPYRRLFRVLNYQGIDVKGGGLKDEVKKVDKNFDGIHIPYSKNHFNVVIATEVLEHAEYPEKLVSEMHRVLKANGRIFITMPFVWPEHGLPFDFQRYTLNKHKLLLEKLGFKIISILPTTGIFGTCGQLISDFSYAEINRVLWGSKLRYGIKFILIRFLAFVICFPTQTIFLLLDEIISHRGITLDYIVEAKKK